MIDVTSLMTRWRHYDASKENTQARVSRLCAIVSSSIRSVVTNRRASPSQEPHESCPTGDPTRRVAQRTHRPRRLARRLGASPPARGDEISSGTAATRTQTLFSRTVVARASSGFVTGGLPRSDDAETSASASLGALTRPPPAFSPLPLFARVRSVRSPRQSPDDVVPVSALRTPIRARARAASRTRPRTICSRRFSARRWRPPEQLGGRGRRSWWAPCSRQRSSHARRVPHRHVPAGFPETVPVRTVNRQCSSGLQAVADVAASDIAEARDERRRRRAASRP